MINQIIIFWLFKAHFVCVSHRIPLVHNEKLSTWWVSSKFNFLWYGLIFLLGGNRKSIIRPRMWQLNLTTNMQRDFKNSSVSFRAFCNLLKENISLLHNNHVTLCVKRKLSLIKLTLEFLLNMKSVARRSFSEFH